MKNIKIEHEPVDNALHDFGTSRELLEYSLFPILPIVLGSNEHRKCFFP